MAGKTGSPADAARAAPSSKPLGPTHLVVLCLITFLFGTTAGLRLMETYVVPASVSAYFRNFTYVNEVTPLTHWSAPLIWCTGYLLVVAISRKLFRGKPLDLYYLRVVHNAILCSGSLVMLIALVTETYSVYSRFGIESMLCDENLHQHKDSNLMFWYWVFYLSKYYEFIDTGILIARRKPLSFLHVFHHFITAFLCWLGIATGNAVQWVVITLNSAVHVLMYYYFFVQTLGQEPWWKRYLTSIQMVQFVIDVVVMSGRWYYVYELNRQCSGNNFGMWVCYGILVAFLVLFANFYRQQYVVRRRGGAAATKAE